MTRSIYFVRRNPLVTVVAVLFVALLVALIGAHFSSSAQAEGLTLPELPGFENGTDTQFVIDDSDYHNITLTSTETVTLRVTSVTNLITIRVHDDPTTGSTDFTISGLPAEATFYRYEDGFAAGTTFTTDASGTYMYTQDLTDDHLVYIQEQPSTFNIGAPGGGDCAAIGSWDEATTTCTLTQSVTQTIFLDNGTLNGAGHSVSGPPVGVHAGNNTTVENLTITNVTQGIITSFGAQEFSGTTIRNNTISDASQWAIATDSGGHRIEGNSISSSGTLEPHGAISIEQSGDPGPDTIIIGNTLENNVYGIWAGNDLPVPRGTSNFQILGNTFSNDIGILSYMDHLVISGNAFTDQAAGVALGADRNVVARNYFQGGIYGVYLVENPNVPFGEDPIPATRAQVYNNNFKELGSDFFEEGYVGSDTPNSLAHRHVFSLAMPVAGNFWDIRVIEGDCTDPDNDLRCEENEFFDLGEMNPNMSGIVDETPWFQFDGWFNATHGISAPPIVGHDSQTLTSSGSPITEGATISEDTVTFSAQVLDLDGDNVELEVELREVGQPFTGIDDGGIHRSGFLSSDGATRMTMPLVRPGLISGSYHWRVRAVDEHGAASAWWEYGLPGNTDFVVDVVTTPTIINPSAPDTFNSVPVFANGTCSSANVDVEWLDASQMVQHSSTEPCNGGAWAADSGELANGDYTLKVCNSGTALCATQTFDVDVPIKVAVILAEPSGSNFSSGYDKDYVLNAIVPGIKDYWCETSFGDRDVVTNECSAGLVRISLDADDIYDAGGQFYSLSKSLTYYGDDNQSSPSFEDPNGVQFDFNGHPDLTAEMAWDAINAADYDSMHNPNGEIADFSQYDTIITVYPGYSAPASERLLGQKCSACPNAQHVGVTSIAPTNSPTQRARRWINVSEEDPVGTWVHEIGHAVGHKITQGIQLPDLYEESQISKGEIGDWGLMGRGHWNGGPFGAKPAQLSSFSRLFLDWLSLPQTGAGFGTHLLGSLEKQEPGTDVLIYDFDGGYYILEARTNNSFYSDWDTGLPKSGLVIYQVEYNATGDRVALVEAIAEGEDPEPEFWNGVQFGVLSTTNNSDDFRVELEIAPYGPLQYVLGSSVPDGSIQSAVEELGLPDTAAPLNRGSAPAEAVPPPTDGKVGRFESAWRWVSSSRFPERLVSFGGCTDFSVECHLLSPGFALFLISILFWLVVMGNVVLARVQHRELSERMQKLAKYALHALFFAVVLLLIFIYWLLFPRYDSDSRLTYLGAAVNASTASGTGGQVGPDLDLHAYDNLGNHVGVNYETGMYENQIPGAETSGDLYLMREWIAVPEGTSVHFEVSTHDIDEFLTENPDIAAELPSLEETYEFGAVTYDVNGTRYEAIPVEDIAINPGEVIVHEIGGTTESPTVDAGTVDDAGPVIFHTSLNASYPFNSSSVEFDFSADDALSGVASVSATLNGNPITSGTALTFDVLGDYEIVITAEDNAGNETIETINYSVVDVVPPVVTHTTLNASYLLNSPSVVFDYSATDDASGVASLSATLDGQALNSGDTLTFDVVGDHQIVITATDNAGNQTVETIDFSVIYDFVGFQNPVKNDGSGIYQQGRTLPVKFELFDVNGVVIDDTTTTISMAHIGSGISGSEEVPLSAGNNDTGNVFRWDEQGQQYIYNLDTSGMAIGTWEIYADLDDGTRHAVEISIRD